MIDFEYDSLAVEFKSRARAKDIFRFFLSKQTIETIGNSKIPKQLQHSVKGAAGRLSSWGYLVKSIEEGFFGPPTNLIYKTLPKGGIPLWWAHPWLPKKSKYYSLELKPETLEKLVEVWLPFLDLHYKNNGILMTDASTVDQLYLDFQREFQKKILEQKQQKELSIKLAKLANDEMEVVMFGETLFPCQTGEYSYQEIEGAIWLMELEMARIGQLVSPQVMAMRLRQFVTDLEECLFDKAFGIMNVDKKGFLRAFRAVLQAYTANPEHDLAKCKYKLKTKALAS